MKFAICNELFEDWDFRRVCHFVRSVGYEGLEVAPFTLAPLITDLRTSQLQQWRREAEHEGVDIVGMHWLLAKTDGMHLTSPDADVRKRLATYLVSLAEACHHLGGGVLVFGSPKQRSLHPDVSPAQAFEWARETFQSALPAIADFGVSICMEPLAPVETDFITTCAQAVELVDAVAHPNFVLHLDVKQMCSEPEPVPDLIRKYAGRAGHFHANDANLRGPGFGETDFIPVFHALNDAGYDGWVSVEVFNYEPDAETVARKSLDHMKDCLRPLGQ